jgi:hypothetical protein
MSAGNAPAPNSTFRRKRLAGRTGVGLLLLGSVWSLPDWGLPQLPPEATVGLLGRSALALMLWASVLSCVRRSDYARWEGMRCVPRQLKSPVAPVWR